MIGRGLNLLLAVVAVGSIAKPQTAYGEAFREAWSAMQLGRAGEAVERLEACLELAPESGIVAYYLACAHARAGAVDEALEWLRAASRWGWDDRGVAEWDPDLVALHATDSFARWLESLPNAPPDAEPVRIVSRESPPPVVGSPGRRVLTSSCVVDGPEERLMASSCKDGTIRLWSTEDGETVKILSGADRACTCIEFDQTGRLLAAGGGDGRVRIWDLASGRLLHTFTAHPDRVSEVRLSPDGRRLFTSGYDPSSTSYDTRPTLWDPRTGARIARLEGRTRRINGSGWSPDGCIFAAGGSNDRTFLWDGDTGELLRVLEHESAVYCLAWSPDGRVLALGVGHNRVHLYDVDHGTKCDELAVPAFGPSFPDFVCCVEFDRTGRHLVAAAGLDVHIWDLRAHERMRLGSFAGGTMSTLYATFRPDGKAVVSSGRGPWTNRVYLLETDEPAVELGDRVNLARWSADGRWLLSGARLLDTERYRVRLNRREFEGGASLRYTTSGYHDGEESATASSRLSVGHDPLDGYAPLLLDPKRVRASLARVDLGVPVLHPAPAVEVKEQGERAARVGEGVTRLAAHAESALGILRFEVRQDGRRIDSADIAKGTTLEGDGSARLELDVSLQAGRGTTSLEVRAVDRKGVASRPVLCTLYGSEDGPTRR